MADKQASPEIVTPADNAQARTEAFQELWPTAGEPLRMRLVTTIYTGEQYRTLRGSAWNYEIKAPTVEFAQDILEVYDLLEDRLKQFGPKVLLALLEKIA